MPGTEQDEPAGREDSGERGDEALTKKPSSSTHVFQTPLTVTHRPSKTQEKRSAAIYRSEANQGHFNLQYIGQLTWRHPSRSFQQEGIRPKHWKRGHLTGTASLRTWLCNSSVRFQERGDRGRRRGSCLPCLHDCPCLALSSLPQ